MPIAVTALAISFALKPRKNDLGYKVALYAQYFIFMSGKVRKIEYASRETKPYEIGVAVGH